MSRYHVTTASGEAGVRTDSLDEAEKYAAKLGGQVIDTEAS